MCAELISLARTALDENRNGSVALHDGWMIDRQRFGAAVANLAAALRQQPHLHYALYYETTYPFATMLFALWHAGKQVWIPGNNRPATADQLVRDGGRLLGDWPDHDVEQIGETSSVKKECALRPLDLQQTRLTIFTSGSSGEPKAIVKTLSQLQSEVEVLERQWGAMLGQATAVATVSHQHIYGLLFKLLWPLASGRCFHSSMYLSPEPMLKALAATPAYWVASPAQLKRLDDLTDWGRIERLTAIFSSGGPLPKEAASLIERCSGHQVVEVYGSSETGGIGWRCSPANALWTAFSGIDLSRDELGRCRLHSPFLPPPGYCLLDDRIEIFPDGRFVLAGRLDRIVKVEEKRLSLDQMEQALQRFDLVDHAHCLVLTGQRERIAAVIVASERGQALLRQQGRGAVTRQLRRHLMQLFETVVLPRKWLFFDALPQTPQGKIDNVLLLQLLQLDTVKFPQILYGRLQDNKILLDLRVRPELIYFDGHFPQQPILPGVAQLAWVECYGKLFFAIKQPFMTMEVIKFKKIIQPGALLTMTLEWKPATGKLYFEVNSAEESHSSGRMVYGGRP
ncbi:MAG: AMP-binding protein [Gammaproteobacteria bacterium]